MRAGSSGRVIGMNEDHLQKGADIIIDICGAVEPSERVVIATDDKKKDIAEILFRACKRKGIDPVVVSMFARTNHGEEPPASYAAALQNADVIFAATHYSLFHSNARIEACNAGARWVNLPGYTKEMLTEGGLFVDFPGQRKKAERIGAYITDGSQVRITTKKGTDITFSIAGREAIVEPGISDRPGMVNSPPDIEVCIAPVEGTAQGRIVIDGSIVIDELGPVAEDVVLDVRDGMVVNITGGREAMVFKKNLESATDQMVRNIGEFGIGLNPECRICDSMLEAEGVLGTIHFGIGDNHTMGGTVEASMHTDVVIMDPTVYIDDVHVMENGAHLLID